ncbi:MAG: hypothetical protein V1685_03465, partial [Parcubacteria group bacterium]
KESAVFDVDEAFYLYDLDFFDLKHGFRVNRSHRDDVRALAATLKTLVVDLLGKCENNERIRKVFTQYFADLPDSRSFWRLRLFVMSLCPPIFKDELTTAFFRPLSTEQYHELTSVNEYLKTLNIGFSVLAENEKRKYIHDVIEYFEKKVKDEEDERDKAIYRRDGLRILSNICEHLTNDEMAKCERVFGKPCNNQPEHEEMISRPRVYRIKAKGLVSQEDFGNLPIEEIAKKLRGEWAPDKFPGRDDSEDPAHPQNAEGIGGQIRFDMTKRLQDYLNHSALFFERNALDQHYTYAFIRGIEETIREKKIDPRTVRWEGLINLFVAVVRSGEKEQFDTSVRDRETFGAWLASWTWVHSAMADVLQKLLQNEDADTIIEFSKNRDALLSILRYLLHNADPNANDERLDNPKMKVQLPNDEGSLAIDPFSNAINSVRGQAFQALVYFIYIDGKKFEKEAAVKISEDVKSVYEESLRSEDTRAIMFMYGHYLPSFYFRHKEWIHGLLKNIFPAEPEKKDLYLAAWEGYLANSIYQEMFEDKKIRALYERAIALTPDTYSKRRYFRELDEGLATHLALAFMHYSEFNIGTPLYNAFWMNANSERHGEFIGFIGRQFVSGDNKKTTAVLHDSAASIRKLTDFWDWTLDAKNNVNPESLKEYGFWINTENAIFEAPWLAERVRKTLEKTGGIIEWDLGIKQSIVNLAKDSPANALSILRLLLLEGGVRSKKMRIPFYMDAEWFDAFQALYNNSDTKADTYALINDLIREGGSIFWKLKEVINE